MRCLNLVQFFFERKNEYHFSNVWMNKLYKLYESEDGIWRCDCLHVGRFDHLTTQRQIIMRCYSGLRTIPDKQRKIYMARLGFEPATFGLLVRCSTN